MMNYQDRKKTIIRIVALLLAILLVGGSMYYLISMILH